MRYLIFILGIVSASLTDEYVQWVVNDAHHYCFKGLHMTYATDDYDCPPGYTLVPTTEHCNNNPEFSVSVVESKLVIVFEYSFEGVLETVVLNDTLQLDLPTEWDGCEECKTLSNSKNVLVLDLPLLSFGGYTKVSVLTSIGESSQDVNIPVEIKACTSVPQFSDEDIEIYGSGISYISILQPYKGKINKVEIIRDDVIYTTQILLQTCDECTPIASMCYISFKLNKEAPMGIGRIALYTHETVQMRDAYIL